VEYRYDLVKPRSFRVFGANLYGGLKLAIFGDIGTVWNEGEQFTRNFIGGVGVGLRVVVPFIQMIRFDLAVGESGQGLVPHFGIREKAFYHRRRVR
jgi:outer membrane translocation and assembly module TamA